MFRFKKWLTALALTIAACLATGSRAHAGASITLQEVGVLGPTTIPLVVVGGIYATGPILFGDYQINVTGSDSAPGVNPFTNKQTISQNTLTVKALNLGAGDLIITVQDDTFTNTLPGGPSGPVSLLANSLSATQIDTGSVSAFGFVTGVGGGGATSTVTIPAQVEPPVGQVAGSTALVTLGTGATFTLGNVATIHGLQVGATDNFTITTTLATPAPAGLILALSGLPLLGLPWLRRRKLKTA